MPSGSSTLLNASVTILVRLLLVKAPVSISVSTTGAVGSDVTADMSDVGSGMTV